MKFSTLFLAMLLVMDLYGQGIEVHYYKRLMHATKSVPAKFAEMVEAQRKYDEDSSSFVHFKMIFNDGKQVYYPLYEIRDTTLVVNGAHVTIHKDSDRAYFLYQDFTKNQHLSRGSAFGKTYSISDTIPVMDWSLLDDVKYVAGYACNKAIGYEGGRKITVWYTEAIPLPLGPRHYGGLPGLILRREFGREIEEAYRIILLQEPPAITAPTFTEKPLNWQSFHKSHGSFPGTFNPEQ